MDPWAPWALGALLPQALGPLGLGHVGAWVYAGTFMSQDDRASLG